MDSNRLDAKPEMREAFEAVIDAGFIKEHMIDIKQSYKVDLIGWSVGIVKRLGGASQVFVYSFTDHKILITETDNDGVFFDQKCYKSYDDSELCTFFVQQWKGKNLLYCPVNKDGIMFGGRRWFLQIDRVWGDKVMFVGKDIFLSCVVFDIDGNVLFESSVSDYMSNKGGLLIMELGKNSSIMFDNNMEIVVDKIKKTYFLKYNYCDKPISAKIHEKTLFIAETKNKSFIFDDNFNILIKDVFIVQKVNTVKSHGNINLSAIWVSKDSKENLFGQNFQLVDGDYNDTATWFDSIKFVENGSNVIKISRNGKENLVNEWDLTLIFDEWFDEIVPLKSNKTSFRYVAAVENKGQINLLNIDPLFFNDFSKPVTNIRLDDIFEYKDIIYVEIDGDKYALWRLLKNNP